MYGRTTKLRPVKFSRYDVKPNTAKQTNVVFLGQTCKDNGEFPAIAQVEGYWNALSCGHKVPARGDVDPRGLEDALSNTFILECMAPSVARFRLAGHHLNDLMGLDVRGMPLTSLFFPNARQQIGQVIENTCASPAISEICLSAPGSFGRPALRAKMLLAPLTDYSGRVNRILGCLQSKGSIGHQPRRFSIKDVKTRDMSLHGIQSKSSTARKQTAFAENAARNRTSPETEKPGVVRPALELVVNNG